MSSNTNRWWLQCAACFELAYPATTLACGQTVCLACVRTGSNLSPGRTENVNGNINANSSTNSSENDGGTQHVEIDSEAVLEAALAASFSENNNNAENAQSNATAATKAAALCRAVRCPARSCRRRHPGRVSPDVAINKLARALYPAETTILDACSNLYSNTSMNEPGNNIIASNNSNAINSGPDLYNDGNDLGLQLPALVRSRVALAKGDFNTALHAADLAHTRNPRNRRGIIARRIAEMRWKDTLGVTATFPIDDPASDSGPISQNNFTIGDMDTVFKSSANNTGNRVDEGSNVAIPSRPNNIDVDIDCPLCLNVLCDPVTLKCGHTACRVCILNSLTYSSVCGICRTELPTTLALLDYPQNRILTAISVEWMSSDLLDAEERKAWLANVKEHHSALERFRESMSEEFVMPIFACTLALPGTKQEFHIFEPRYRVMIKECLESNKPFGLCIPIRSMNPFEAPKISEFGTAVSIQFSEELADNVQTSKGSLPRYFVQSIARFRFQVTNSNHSTSPEGLRYAKVKRIEDIDPTAYTTDSNIRPSSASTSSASTTSSLETRRTPFNQIEYARNILKIRKTVLALMSSWGPARLRALENGFGRMPDDPAMLSFWAAQHLNIPMQVFLFNFFML